MKITIGKNKPFKLPKFKRNNVLQYVQQLINDAEIKPSS